MITHKYRALFLHIPKCGGTSMEQWMKRNADAPHPAHRFRSKGLTRWINSYPHYFLFTFVRNPYDRFISIYRHGSRGYEIHENRDYYQRSVVNLDIHEYARLIRDNAWEQLSKFDRYHARLQVSFIPDHCSYLHNAPLWYKTACSLIGRFECINEDFAVLQEALGMPNVPLYHTDKYADLRRKHQHSNEKQHYSEFYDTELRQLVEEIYAQDIEQFGYTFEESGNLPPTNIPAPQVESCRQMHQQICQTVRASGIRIKVQSLYSRLKIKLQPTMKKIRRITLRLIKTNTFTLAIARRIREIFS